MIKCLLATCKKPAVLDKNYRGLCMGCFGTAKRAVASKTTTWEYLEQHGLAHPLPTGGMLDTIKQAQAKTKDNNANPESPAPEGPDQAR